MTIMGKYCKIYSLKKLRQFNKWAEYIEKTRTKKNEIKEKESGVIREMTESNFLYLQENYVVTYGIFKDENIIFDKVTPEWKDFCTKVLKFETPIYETVEVKASTGKD
jgi:hypothetical protein